MIPLLARIHIRHPRLRMRLWLPLFLLWLVLLPIAILLLPVFLVGCLFAGTNPFRLLWLGWCLMAGLSGTHVEVDGRDQRVLISFS